jgi:membrane associated rhomboid family serine protease
MSANTIIIVLNVIVFMLQMMTSGAAQAAGAPARVFGDVLTQYGHFSTAKVMWSGGLEFWRVLTFQFLHADIVHILFNMMGLWVFGKIVEQQLGAKRYTALYLTCGVAGAVLYMLLNAGAAGVAAMGIQPFPPLIATSANTPLVGASAGVFGVVMAAAYVAPNVQLVLLIPPVPVRIKTLAYVYVGLAAANLFIFAGPNQGGDAAHIGGAIAGYVLIRNVHLLRDFFDIFGDSRGGRGKRGGGGRGGLGGRGGRGGLGGLGGLWGRGRGGESGVDGGGVGGTVGGEAGEDRRAKAARQREEERVREVDRILQKIKEKGMGSLSNREKRVLQDDTAARNTSGRG